MLIKDADDRTAQLQALERLAAGMGPEAKQAADELRRRKAGVRGEKDSAYLINFDYARSPNWAVIHDLRLEHGDRVAQIDHLLINRWMDVYVLETKHFHAGIKITEEGEFLRWNNFRRTFEGMASPLEQNERHIQVLKDVMTGVELPTRLGVRIPPAFQSFVLVGPDARIDRPRKFDTSRVVKADQLKKAIWRDFDNGNALIGIVRTAAKIVSGETVEFVARQLVALHRPGPGAAPPVAEPAPEAAGIPRGAAAKRTRRIEPTLGAMSISTSPAQPPGPECKECRGTSGAIQYGRYGYYFQCGGCGTNTAIRFSCKPGHKPRLRKEKERFYRECEQCGSSDLFHINESGVAAR
ncbi:nuclease-related domain-containing protein [Luteimonas sp. R10]|uniref:nuclease-related domain-containing protein n=1 Tax=Luteimonas sp. R10 TaxID=3108176 RepID=UPI0030931FB3|nr:nuclease-related domain-containing protein [Luteimonas sp. R10]